MKTVVPAAGEGMRLRPLMEDKLSPAIFYACRLVQPSNRGEYEISEVVNLLIQSGRTIDAIGLERWRIDVGYPEDRDEVERRLSE